MKKEHVVFYQDLISFLPSEDDLDDIATSELGDLFLFLDLLEKKCKNTKNEIRANLLKAAAAIGVKNKSGHLEYDSNHAVITNERRQANLPKMADLVQLLEDEGLDKLEAFDESKVYEINPSKLDRLLETGKLDRIKYDALRGETHVLKVKPNRNTKELIKTLTV